MGSATFPCFLQFFFDTLSSVAIKIIMSMAKRFFKLASGIFTVRGLLSQNQQQPAVITMSSNYSRLSDYVFKKNTVSNMFILRKLK